MKYVHSICNKRCCAYKKSQRQQTKEKWKKKSQTNVNMSEWNFHTTMLLIWTFLNIYVYSVLVSRWFSWKQIAICLCHIRTVHIMCAHTVFFTLICQLHGKCEYQMLFFRIFDAHINPHRDRKTNNNTINSSKFRHKNRWIHFICFR